MEHNCTLIFLTPDLKESRSGLRMRSESELFTGDTSKDNHSSEPVIRGLVPSPQKRVTLVTGSSAH